MGGWVDRKSNPVGKKYRLKGESWLRNCGVAAMGFAERDHPGKSPDTYAGF